MSGLGMVIAGGAARGAWQAGVLRFIYQELPAQIGFAPWPSVVSGNSVGALNGVHVAARSKSSLARLGAVWNRMQIDQVYRISPGELASHLYNGLWQSGPFSLLDVRPLYRLVHHMYPEAELREAIAFGDTRAFMVTATELDTGRATVFLDTHDPGLWLDSGPRRHVVRGQVTHRHCLASSALPMLFRPVKVNGRYYVDGMLRQNTPIRPVIQAGMSHIMVIGIDQQRHHTSLTQSASPTLSLIAGKTLHTLLMDPIDRELRSVQKFNALVRWGVERYGPEFESALFADHHIRDVRVMRISPSEDLGAIAIRSYQKQPPSAPFATRQFLSLLADPSNVGESDLLSYLLFDRSYTATIEALGYEDAKRNAERIASFVIDAREQQQREP